MNRNERPYDLDALEELAAELRFRCTRRDHTRLEVHWPVRR